MIDNKEKITKLSSAIKFLNLSFLLMVFVYVAIYAFAWDTIFMYAAIPFVLAFWISVIRLSSISYGLVMATVSIFAILFPPGLILIMLLSYSRAVHFIKQEGLKISFMGEVVER